MLAYLTQNSIPLSRLVGLGSDDAAGASRRKMFRFSVNLVQANP